MEIGEKGKRGERKHEINRGEVDRKQGGGEAKGEEEAPDEKPIRGCPSALQSIFAEFPQAGRRDGGRRRRER